VGDSPFLQLSIFLASCERFPFYDYLFIYLFYPFPTGLVSPPLASHILSSTCFPPPLAHPECACLLAPVERKGEEKGHLTAVGVSYCCFFSLLFSFSYITRLHRFLFDFLISFCQEGCRRSLWVSPPSHLDHLLLLDSAFRGHPGSSVVLFLIFFFFLRLSLSVCPLA